ncbi:MAG: hypothetical protein E6I80_16390 [Chloroflexi bacterium]|nr:MAG: hypothetical protein E6I80_16390 [Chloroflexota bacterium]
MTTNIHVRSIEEKRRRKRLFWLCIAGGTGALTLIAPALVAVIGNALKFPGEISLPNSPPLAWYHALGINVLLGIGPMLSMVICWHFIVNRAKRVTWYRGLLAGWVASVLAYPLTAIVAALILSFMSIGIEVQLPVLLGLSVLAAIISLFLLPSLFGLATSILGVILGSLLGWLQGHDEARLAL